MNPRRLTREAAVLAIIRVPADRQFYSDDDCKSLRSETAVFDCEWPHSPPRRGREYSAETLCNAIHCLSVNLRWLIRPFIGNILASQPVVPRMQNPESEQIRSELMFFLRRVVILAAGCLLLSSFATPAAAQSAASGTIEGTVVDPTGAVVAGETVETRHPMSRFQHMPTTDSMGGFRLTNLPLNPYHGEVTARGF